MAQLSPSRLITSESSAPSALTGGIPLVLRNLRSIVKTLGIEAEFLHTLEANYAQQAATTFRNLSTMLGWGDISRYTSSSIASYLAVFSCCEWSQTGQLLP